MRVPRIVLSVLLSATVVATGLIVTETPAAAYNPVNCHSIALRAVANGKYVSTEVAYTGTNDGLLRARNDYIGPWEEFHLCDIVGGGRTGYSQAVFSDLNGNNGWWSMEKGLDGRVRARPEGTVIDIWEEFLFVRASGCPTDDCYSIRSVENNKWVSTEISEPSPYYKGFLRARADVVGPWEKYDIIRLSA
jgi:hypothetical protein